MSARQVRATDLYWTHHSSCLFPELIMSIAAGTLHHTCFVVHDVEKTAQSLADSVGIGPWAVFSLEPAVSYLRGEPVPFSFKAALAEVGGASYELIQPLAGNSLYVEHLAAHGEGFHHSCIAFATHEDMLTAKADLSSRGLEAVQSGSFGELADFVYFMVPEMGGLLELMYLDAELLPPPDAVIE